MKFGCSEGKKLILHSYLYRNCLISDRDDCVALYSGGNAHSNWETVTCFQERAYICEIPEGQPLASGPAVSGDSSTYCRH